MMRYENAALRAREEQTPEHEAFKYTFGANGEKYELRVARDAEGAFLAVEIYEDGMPFELADIYLLGGKYKVCTLRARALTAVHKICDTLQEACAAVVAREFNNIICFL